MHGQIVSIERWQAWSDSKQRDGRHGLIISIER